MKVSCLVTILLTGTFFTATAFGASEPGGKEPVVTISIEPDSVIVGKMATLRIKVLVPTWFTSPSIYPSFDKLNVISRLPPNSTYPVTEAINGESWPGIIREYEIYPQSVGVFVYESESILVDYADEMTRASTKIELSVPSVKLAAVIPRGAETLNPFLASTKVTLDREIEGKTENIRTGDAIVIDLVAKIRNMPAMFLPGLLRFPESPEYTAYPEEAMIEEHREDRSTDSSSSRRERITVIFERPGRFVMPAIELKWWNTTTETIQTSALPEQVIMVTGEPISKAGEEPVSTTNKLTGIGIAIVVLLVLLATGRKSIMAAFSQRRIEFLDSEHHALKVLTASIHNGAKKEIYRDYLLWKDKVAQDSMYPFQPNEFDTLGRDLYNNADAPSILSKGEKKPLAVALKKIRQDAIKHTKNSNSPLPALNR